MRSHSFLLKPVKWIPILLALLMFPPVVLTIEYITTFLVSGTSEEEQTLYLLVVTLILSVVICVFAGRKSYRWLQDRGFDQPQNDPLHTDVGNSMPCLNSLAGLSVIGLLSLYVPVTVLKIHVLVTGDLEARWEIIRFLPVIALVLVFLFFCLTGFVVKSLKTIFYRRDRLAHAAKELDGVKAPESVRYDTT